MKILEAVFNSCLGVLKIDMTFFGAYTFSLFDVLIVLVVILILCKAAFSFFRW